MRNAVVFVIISLALVSAGFSHQTVLGISGQNFTISVDGGSAVTTFLTQMSYFGALTRSSWSYDLDRMQRDGFNTVRVFALWDLDDDFSDDHSDDYSAVFLYGDYIGTERTTFMDRLIALAQALDSRHMVMDCTFYTTYYRNLGLSSGQWADCIETTVQRVANAGLKNVYFDVANEWDVGYGFNPTVNTVIGWLQTVWSINGPDNYKYLRTASAVSLNYWDLDSYGGYLDFQDFLQSQYTSFLAPHLDRSRGCWNFTKASVRRLLYEMASVQEKTVPILLNEPFQRDDDAPLYQPTVEARVVDFQEDRRNAREAGVAGWCYHLAMDHMLDLSSQTQYGSLEQEAGEDLLVANIMNSTLHAEPFRTMGDLDSDGVNELAVCAEHLVAANLDVDSSYEICAYLGLIGLWKGDYSGTWSWTLMTSPTTVVPD